MTLDVGGRGLIIKKTVKVLLEEALRRYKRGIGPGKVAANIGDVIAVRVGVPQRIGIGAWRLPGDFVAGCGVLRSNRRPVPNLAGGKILTGKLQRWSASVLQQIKMI